jgi:hypothetical protein
MKAGENYRMGIPYRTTTVLTNRRSRWEVFPVNIRKRAGRGAGRGAWEKSVVRQNPFPFRAKML